MTQLHWLEIFRRMLFLLQQKGLALYSVGNALIFLGNKLIVNCLEFLAAVEFLPITSPGSRTGAGMFLGCKDESCDAPAGTALNWQSGTKGPDFTLRLSHLRDAWPSAKPAVLSRRLPAFFLPGR